jgi:hypothetical protein
MVRLTVGGTLRVDGAVTANGADGQSWPDSGGSGGSIYLRAGSVGGSGVVSANGGNAIDNPAGGGGGGGRIALYYQTNSFSGALTATGGAGWEYGGAGTIYTKSGSEAYGVSGTGL